ncbi:MAG: hypothetical protein MI923_04185 [Phycisphaerales bacterium]|nr:hypothetical protein [Phycisphaerales bacterium]
MAQAPRVKPGNDIYTVLAAIALALVAGTIGFVLYRCNELLGTPFPGFAG